MPEEIITRDSAAFKELYRDIVKAIRAVDILIDTHRPTIGNELYLTSEEICSIFSISKRSLQNYRDNRQIPYTATKTSRRLRIALTCSIASFDES